MKLFKLFSFLFKLPLFLPRSFASLQVRDREKPRHVAA